jgi:hypothetical protein
MAPPPRRFGTHDGDMTLAGKGEQLFERVAKLRCGHVIRVAAESRMAPSPIRRLVRRAPPAAKVGEVPVLDASSRQRLCKRFAGEVRLAPGAGEAPNVCDTCDSVVVQDLCEPIERVRGVTDRAHNRRRRHAWILSRDGWGYVSFPLRPFLPVCWLLRHELRFRTSDAFTAEAVRASRSRGA